MSALACLQARLIEAYFARERVISGCAPGRETTTGQ